jgi:hypothetical protein
MEGFGFVQPDTGAQKLTDSDPEHWDRVVCAIANTYIQYIHTYIHTYNFISTVFL